MKQQQYVQGNKNRIKYSRLSIVTLIAGVAMLFFSCENKIEKIQEYSAVEDLPAIESEGLETVYSDSAIIRFKLKAPKLLRYDDVKEPFSEFPDGIELEEYDAQMNVVSRITADYALKYDKDEKWVAKNNVIVVNMEGDSLKTEELVWEKAKGKLYSEQYVEIVRKDQIIRGIGFESDQDMSNWEIKNVTGQLFLEVPE